MGKAARRRREVREGPARVGHDRRVEQPASGPGRPLVLVVEELHRCRVAREQLRAAELELIATAVEGGMTWSAIGRALGISPQAARALALRNGVSR